MFTFRIGLQPRRDFFELALAAARDAEDATMEEAAMLSLAYADSELGTFASLFEDFKTVGERAGTLKHYKNLILFLTLAGEIIITMMAILKDRPRCLT